MSYKKYGNSELFDDKSTIDVRFEGEEVLLIKQKKWTTKELEDQVANLHYSGENLPKDHAVEKARLPPFALSFYKFVFFKSRLPDETELWNYYLKQHFTPVDGDCVQVYIRGTAKTFVADSVKARMLRSYPSLVRDFHFYVLCLTSDRFERVRYSLHQDYFDGIDLSVVYAGVEFQVSILLNSPRAQMYKSQKYKRHEERPQNEVIMLFDLSRSFHERGKIKLFSERNVQELIEELKLRVAT
ncbi:hypothetical protein [Runella aurantiaca]|uniref:Uncharacterized protein n=1 Tax=Runella aurantiaca TaxID=2282308 RepID=A0A369IES6_9BACT|nr:hypothetical protein [Runella aurantiaca]RDB06003.1 hypothetical protein DVG78_11405 [Runella aurantiaca]